ncbi:MAG: ribonuclease HI family protein [Elusimicrobia bacterium]|nr:ribonuclease HI family protein [Elusimicrobiota bacterium]
MKEPKLIIYIDGGSRGNPGHGACAAAIFGAGGRLLAEEGKYLGRCTNNFAEYNGLYLALYAARRLGAHSLEIFSDSELLVKQFACEYKIKDAVLRGLMEEIKKAASHFGKLTLSHVPRSKNIHADTLVNEILDNTARAGVALNKSVAMENAKKIRQPELF